MDRVLLTWDEYFMGVAILSSFRSKDPRLGNGACIANNKNRIVGVGYNGFPNGCADEALPWGSDGDYLDTKYPYVCHAELNAILNSGSDLSDCRIYTSSFPCNECAKAIIQSGIREVIYLDYNKSCDSDIFIAARKLFDLSDVTYRKLVPIIEELVLEYSVVQESAPGEASGYFSHKS